jgi:hypothetical protein
MRTRLYITVRSYKNYDPTAFSSDLATKSDRLLSIFTETDVSTKTEVLKDVIQSTLKQSKLGAAPTHSLRPTRKNL